MLAYVREDIMVSSGCLLLRISSCRDVLWPFSLETQGRRKSSSVAVHVWLQLTDISSPLSFPLLFSPLPSPSSLVPSPPSVCSTFATGSCDGSAIVWRCRQGVWSGLTLRIPQDQASRCLT